MNEFEILLTVLMGGITLNIVLLGFLWTNLNNRIDKSEASLCMRLDKLDEKLTDVDRCLCRIEGAMSSKDCCVLKDERLLKRAE